MCCQLLQHHTIEQRVLGLYTAIAAGITDEDCGQGKSINFVEQELIDLNTRMARELGLRDGIIVARLFRPRH